MKQKKIPFTRPSIDSKEKKAVCRVLKSGWLTTGTETFNFEKEMASFLGIKHAIAVNSNTAGLFLSMEACGLTEGKVLLTTPYTFTATATVARHLGAEVKFCDVKKDTYNIDIEQSCELLEKNKKTNIIHAFAPVHFGGLPCNMEELMTVAENLPVIEDCAHSFPSKTKWGYAGTKGTTGVFSFYSTKTITTGEGGMVVTNNDKIAKRIYLMRANGIDRNVWDRYTNTKASWMYDVIEAGYKLNMPDILSAIGRIQLLKANKLLEKRQNISKQYLCAFKDYDFILPPPDGIGNAWHIYPLRLNLDLLDIDRDQFAIELQEKGVGISVHFIPLFLMTYWKNRYNLLLSQFPNAYESYLRTISIPIWPDMTQKMIQQVIKNIIEVGIKHYKKKSL